MPTWDISAQSPIRRAWLFFVLPGARAQLLRPGSADHPRRPARSRTRSTCSRRTGRFLPMVVLATCATVIASQAVISGAFSLTRQAIQMGYCPRLTITHTSDREIGQIYVPFINWMLLLAVMLLVAGFQSSSNLAAAYGIAVTLAMAIDSLLIYVVLTRLWHWNRLVALAIVAPLLAIDLSFLASNALKIPEGGWFPIVDRRRRVHAAHDVEARALDSSRAPVEGNDAARRVHREHRGQHPPSRVPGTAVFLTNTPGRVPHALLHNLKHNKVLHERVVLLTVTTRDIPHVSLAERLADRRISGAIFSRSRRSSDSRRTRMFRSCSTNADAAASPFDMMDTSFFVSRETLIATVAPGMALWRERLFVSMSKNATKASEFFNVPDQSRGRARNAGRALISEAPNKTPAHWPASSARIRVTQAYCSGAHLAAHGLQRLAFDLADALRRHAVLVGKRPAASPDRRLRAASAPR